MATLIYKMKMNSPNDANDFWANIYEVGKVLAPWATVGVVCVQLINKVFKYFSDSRDAELREIVRKEVQPKLDAMSDKIDRLSDVIAQLRDKR